MTLENCWSNYFIISCIRQPEHIIKSENSVLILLTSVIANQVVEGVCHD